MPHTYRLTLTYERAFKLPSRIPAMDWHNCPKAWFVYLRPKALPFYVAFANREDIPLPPTVRDRLAALDMASGSGAIIPGLGRIVRYSSLAFAGELSYTLEIPKTEYDQLRAALGGEDHA